MAAYMDTNSDGDICAKEQKVLDLYFQALGQFSYDKAKENVERERDAIHKSHQTTAVYSSLLTALSQLSSAERNYTSLMFFVPKGFLRKDVSRTITSISPMFKIPLIASYLQQSSLKAMYEALKTEFTRLDDRSKGCPSPIPSPSLSHPPSLPNPQTPTFVSFISKVSSSSTSQINFGQDSDITGGPDLDKLAGHISSHLLYFVMSRLEMIDFYDKLHSLATTRFIKFDELLISLKEIFSRYQKYFHHPLLTPLKATFNYECEILLKLLEAENKIQQWEMLPSVLLLHESNSKLTAWASVSFAKEARRGYAVIVRPASAPPLYQWLGKLKSLLVSKFTLYFHDVLSQQTTPNEMKHWCSKNSVDLFQKIVTFQRRTDALCVAIVLDTLGLENYKGRGYHHPDKYFDPPKGLDSYPAVLCYPCEKPSSHWPNVIMIINDKSGELNNTDNVVYFYDKQVRTTYYVIKIEPRLTLMALFEAKKPERDNGITYFLQETCSHLRCNKLFSTLKPSSK